MQYDLLEMMTTSFLMMMMMESLTAAMETRRSVCRFASDATGVLSSSSLSRPNHLSNVLFDARTEYRSEGIVVVVVVDKGREEGRGGRGTATLPVAGVSKHGSGRVAANTYKGTESFHFHIRIHFYRIFRFIFPLITH